MCIGKVISDMCWLWDSSLIYGQIRWQLSTVGVTPPKSLSWVINRATVSLLESEAEENGLRGGRCRQLDGQLQLFKVRKFEKVP